MEINIIRGIIEINIDTSFITGIIETIKMEITTENIILFLLFLILIHAFSDILKPSQSDVIKSRRIRSSNSDKPDRSHWIRSSNSVNSGTYKQMPKTEKEIMRNRVRSSYIIPVHQVRRV